MCIRIPVCIGAMPWRGILVRLTPSLPDGVDGTDVGSIDGMRLGSTTGGRWCRHCLVGFCVAENAPGGSDSPALQFSYRWR